MKRKTITLFVSFSCLLACQKPAPHGDLVPPAISLKAVFFPLQQVRLLDSPFKQAMELDQRYLLSLPVDRLLHNFRINAGLPSTAQPFGGWEDPNCELRGHFAGHFMSACAMMHAATGDPRFKVKGDSVVSGLATCQDKIGSGYLSAFPLDLLDRVEASKRVWAPYYTLHKIFAGLLDMHIHTGSRQAILTARKFADWLIERNGRLSDEQMQSMLGTEHGGMNETLANLYAITGEKKYLHLSLRFNHGAVMGPAMQRLDSLTGLHANTQIPKFIGAARQYELTGDQSMQTAAHFFWHTIVDERSYVIGGHSDGEIFSPKEKLSQALGPSTTETCNTYNMLKLTRHLFTWDPSVKYMDYYERAVYNHILASQNPETGMMCYYVPLRSGSRKEYNGHDDAFWCCTGTGVENHAKYGESIYAHDEAGKLYINLFIASELDWRERGLKLKQETRYPQESGSRIVFTCEKSVPLTLKIRRPSWAVRPVQIRVNGVEQKISSPPGSWIELSGDWKSGDVVETEMPFSLYTEGFRDNPHRLAILNGPLVLAGEVETDKPLPVIVTDDGRVLDALQEKQGNSMVFAGSPGFFRMPDHAGGATVKLLPFYQVHGDNRYVVYWDVLNPRQWLDKERQYRTELRLQMAMDRLTVDRILPGEESSEKRHGVAGEKTNSGDFGGRRYRDAYDGGWFSYQVTPKHLHKGSLRVTYWGGDAGRRIFDILIDGVRIATQELTAQKPDSFFSVIYPLTETLFKDRMAITFQAHPGCMAGGVFDVRLIRP